MQIYTVSFFGHRDFNAHYRCESKLISIITELLRTKEYVDFIVGRNGEFDIFAASCVKKAKKDFGDGNSSLILLLPYITAQLQNNQKYFEEYYDEIEISEKACAAHYKSAMQIRNQEMVDRANLIICYTERKSGGAYNAIKYAEKQGKKIINLLFDNTDDLKD